MKTRNDFLKGVRPALMACGLAMALTAGCGLDDVNVPGQLEGPAELANALRLTISPDVITADGFSTALIQAEFRDQNGQPLGNRDVFFAIADESGNFADIGTLFDLAGNQLGATEAIIRTNGNGVAQLIYRAPPRTDATANQFVMITARPVGDDANGANYRQSRLELRSAEPRLFPQVPGNKPPTGCPFAVEAPDGFRAGRSILFQSTGSDVDGTIVRYEYFFGDGTPVDYHPDTNHVFRFPGTYTVTHVCTDDDGGQGASSASIPIS